MTMRVTEPIPVPRSRALRQLREKLVPAASFLCVLLLVAALWNRYLVVPNMVGEVESISVDVISTVPGLLTDLDVERFGRVEQGQVLGRVCPMDPQQLKASLAAMEIDLMVLKARMDLDRTRNAQSLAGLRNDLEVERLSLSSATIQLAQAQKELDRTRRLAEDKLVAFGPGAGRNDFGLDVAVRDRDRLEVEVTSHQKAIRDLEAAVEKLMSLGSNQLEETDPLIDQAIAAQRNKLLLLEGPVELRAPINGVVTAINFKAGTRVMAGAPILTVAPETPEQIVGYARQPLNTVPKPGDRVEIRPRGGNREVAYGKVLSVGCRLQTVTSPMRMRGFDNAQERGLPFLVSLPSGMNILPGELVDLKLYPAREGGTESQ